MAINRKKSDKQKFGNNNINIIGIIKHNNQKKYINIGSLLSKELWSIDYNQKLMTWEFQKYSIKNSLNQIKSKWIKLKVKMNQNKKHQKTEIVIIYSE